MQQQISVITLGIVDLAASKFYIDGFVWKPVFENDEVAFYQMNGLMLGTWLRRNWKRVCAENRSDPVPLPLPIMSDRRRTLIA